MLDWILKKSISKQELARLAIMSIYETTLRQKGKIIIAGVDEVGRGPLAGPVVAAACILEEGFVLEGINDSKKLAPEKRAEIFEKLVALNVHFKIGIVSEKRIDSINILNATHEAMLLAINSLEIKPDFLLIDGNQLPYTSIPSQGIIEGDSKSISIAAASIIAKVKRDAIMIEYDKLWPEYHFADNKGYGTKDHLDALQKHGPCDIHRRSFDPIKSMLSLDLFSSFKTDCW